MNGYHESDEAILTIEPDALDAEIVPEDMASETDYAESGPVGQVTIAGTVIPVAPASATPDNTSATLDDALRYTVAQQNTQTVICGNAMTGTQFRVFRWSPAALPANLASVAVVDFDGIPDAVALVLNGGEVAYFPSNPTATVRRWVAVPRLREFYALPAADRTTHRTRWINAIARAGAGYTKAQLTPLAMPTLRLLLAHLGAQVIPAKNVDQATKRFLGASTSGVTAPIFRYPLVEPECYLAVITEVEGRMESINAYDLGAGVSLGPIQINVQRAALFRFLATLWERDRDLFTQEFGTPFNWTIQGHAAHPDLVVGTTPPATLHGRDNAADVARNIGYFQSGTPGNDAFAQIDAAVRRTFAARFRNVVVWPHVQEIVAEVSAWWLERGLRKIEAAGIPAIDANNPDRDVFILKAMLLSAFVRFSGSLDPILHALERWTTPAEKVQHVVGVLAGLHKPFPSLRDRLTHQQRDAAHAHDAIRRMARGGAAEAYDEAMDEAADDADETTDETMDEAAERAGELLAEIADEAVAVGARGATGGFLAETLAGVGMEAESVSPLGGMGGHFPSAVELYDAFAFPGHKGERAHYARFFDLVAAPGAPLPGGARTGQIIVRRALGEQYAHIAIIAGPHRWSHETLPTRGLAVERPLPGVYVQVIEGGAFPRSRADAYARRLTDATGRLPHDQLILALRPEVMEIAEAPEMLETPASVADAWPEADPEDAGLVESLPADRLRWAGATVEQRAFMRRVYEAQVAHAERARPFVADIPAGELDTIEGSQRARADAASECRTLLAALRADLAQQQASGNEAAKNVRRVTIVSAYRSSSQQFTNWQRNFPRYYAEAQAQRAAKEGGEHGDAAVAYMARYVGQRLAAPGFSLHNDGRAVDFGAREGGTDLGASTSAASIAAWRASWTFAWLSEHAGQYHFFQNTAINEPWHWEHRPATVQTTTTEVDVLEGDIPVPAEGAVAAGRLEVASVPLIAAHRGTPPDLILRWNEMANMPERVDVVLHLHGYSGKDAAMRIDREKEPYSGLDWANPDNASDPTSGRTRPTLGILPRGNYFGGGSGAGYNFPALVTATGAREMIDYALSEFARAVGTSGVQQGRLIISAHSGGGAPLMRILRHLDPDELHVFDATYGDPGALVGWLRNRIPRDAVALADGRDAAAYMREQGGALRVLYRPGSGTARYSETVAREIAATLHRAPATEAALMPWYRSERTRVAHGDIPRRFGWRILADASADLPGATRPRPPGRPRHEADEHGPDTDEWMVEMEADEADEAGEHEPTENVDVERAVRENAAYAASLGWQGHRERIGLLIGLRAAHPTDADVVAAVARWQTAQGLPEDGVIGPPTWERMRAILGIAAAPAAPAAPSSTTATGTSGGATSLTPAEEKAMRITNTFETGARPGSLSYGGLTGNFDGQGISFGLLQWNIGTGSLQPLLRSLDRHAPHAFDAVFGAQAAELRQTLAPQRGESERVTIARQLAWARSVNDAHNHVQEPWRAAFHRLADDPAFRQIELHAARASLDAAARYARQFGLTSERGLAFMFDTVTQGGRGWLRPHGNTERAELIARRRATRERELGHPLDERQLMAVIADVVADTSRPRYREDVRRRRMTIVNGRGTVHGHHFDLEREFGLTDAPWETPAPTPPHPTAPHPTRAVHTGVPATSPAEALSDSDRATAQAQWESHPGVHRAFGGSAARYIEMWPLYNARGITDPAAYIATNITDISFFGHRTPAHRDLIAPLQRAEQALTAQGITPTIVSFWSFNPRPIRGTTMSLSKHAAGRAIDINPTGNPLIANKDDALVIHAATGVDLRQRQAADAMRQASQTFQSAFNAQWIAQQQEPHLVQAIRRRRTMLNDYARHGFFTLEQPLVDALIAAGLTWGGGWETRKDFMHFELTGW